MAGSKRFTADGVVGPSGKNVRVYSATWLSGTTAGDLTLRQGTTTAGDIWVKDGGVISKTETWNSEGGMLFTDGCYVDLDANSTAVVISFIAEP